MRRHLGSIVGKWYTSFNERHLTWRRFAPHDIAYLIQLMGGNVSLAGNRYG